MGVGSRFANCWDSPAVITIVRAPHRLLISIVAHSHRPDGDTRTFLFVFFNFIINYCSLALILNSLINYLRGWQPNWGRRGGGSLNLFSSSLPSFSPRRRRSSRSICCPHRRRCSRDRLPSEMKIYFYQTDIDDGQIGFYLLVSHLEKLQRRLLERSSFLSHQLRIGVILVGEQRSHLGDLLPQLVALVLRQLILVLLHLRLRVVHDRLRLVHRLDALLLRLVRLRVLLRILNHVLDLVLAETARRLDDDLLLLAGALVARRHVHDAVGVDVEGDLDLRNAARRRWNANECECAEEFIVRCHLALALVAFDLHLGLSVGGGGEDLRLLGWNCGVAGDEAREDAAEGFNSERQRRHVQQEHVGDIASENSALHGGTDGDGLVRVDGTRGLTTEDVLNGRLDLWHARHAADQQNFPDVRLGHLRIGQRLLARRDGALDEIANEILQLRARHLQVHVLGSALVHRQVRQVDVGLYRRRQLALCLLRRFLQPLHRHRILADVQALLLLELVHQIIDDVIVEVFAAEQRVAVGRLHLENSLLDLEDGNVEGSASQIVHGDAGSWSLSLIKIL